MSSDNYQKLVDKIIKNATASIMMEDVKDKEKVEVKVIKRNE